jgi:hypothetical protein
LTYFADLSPYTYHEVSGPWRELLNVGWLEPPHPVPTGAVPTEFVDRLGWLCANATVDRTRGLHRSRLGSCGGIRSRRPAPVALDGREVYLGGAEVRVGVGEGTWFSAPDLVYHYVVAHGYRPPEGFVEAVLRGSVAEDGGG